MRRRLSFSARSAARVLTLIALSATTAGAQTSIGDALIPRGFLDVFSGFILVSGHDVPAPVVGHRLASVSTFGGQSQFGSNVGRQFTPLIVSMSAIGDASFSVVGVGTARSVLDGVNTYDFGLTAGSDLMGAGMRFGWMNSGLGAILFDNLDGDGIQFAFTDPGVVAPSVGGSYNTIVSSPQDRAYSIQFNLVPTNTPPPPTVVPEPSTYTMLGAGLMMLVAIDRRRRRA